MTGFTRYSRHHEIWLDSNDQHRESTQRQKKEAGENQDMQEAGRPVARMLPLSEPVLGDLPQARQRLVKAEIAFRTEERRESSRHDVGEADDTEDMNEYKERQPCAQPRRNLRSGFHNT